MKPHLGKRLSSVTHDADLGFTVMLLGDSCCGKTCLLIRFKDGAFLNNNFISTVGIDYRNKLVDVDNVKVKLQIWDTAGQERFRSVTSAYYRDADALLLVYDVTNRKSFDNIRNWLAQIREYASESVLITMVGNKIDLVNQRKVTTDEAKQLAQSYDIPYLETSAKTGHNVSEVFMHLARRLCREKMGESGTSSSAIADIVELNNKDVAASRAWTNCCGSATSPTSFASYPPASPKTA